MSDGVCILSICVRAPNDTPTSPPNPTLLGCQRTPLHSPLPTVTRSRATLPLRISLRRVIFQCHGGGFALAPDRSGTRPTHYSPVLRARRLVQELQAVLRALEKGPGAESLRSSLLTSAAVPLGRRASFSCSRRSDADAVSLFFESD